MPALLNHGLLVLNLSGQFTQRSRIKPIVTRQSDLGAEPELGFRTITTANMDVHRLTWMTFV
jgi:hypothetical protein